MTWFFVSLSNLQSDPLAYRIRLLAEDKEIIGGFFVVDARDYDEAVSVAKGCPHLDFGTIEVREIEPMP